MNYRLIRFHRPRLRGLIPDAINLPFTNLTVTIHHDTESAASRWRHWSYEDGTGGELQCGRWLFIYGLDMPWTDEGRAWSSEVVA